MYLLEADQFRQQCDWEWARFVAELKARISSDRCVLIRNLNAGDSNELLIRLATSLGRPYNEPGFPRHPPEDKIVSRVEQRSEGIRDLRGIVLYSTTNLAFPSHTDGSGKRDPYDLVLLYCVRQDLSGGESILIPLDDILKLLTQATINCLRSKSFPVPFGRAPIISGEEHNLWIRYNAEELALYSHRHNITFTQNQKQALNALAGAISSLEQEVPKFRISMGECLVIDNKRVLHGRSALSPNSHRLLKRIRVHWQ
jgi:TfdA family taurine catabolism dioxygenase TauD